MIYLFCYSSKLPILCFKKTFIFKKLNDPNCSVWILEKYMWFKIRCVFILIITLSVTFKLKGLCTQIKETF